MTQKEKQMAAYLLYKARNEFSNHGCNDVDDEIYKGWSLEERRALVKDFHNYNGDPEEYNPDFLHLHDYALMGYFSHKLESENDVKNNELDKLLNELILIKQQLTNDDSKVIGMTMLSVLILELKIR